LRSKTGNERPPVRFQIQRVKTDAFRLRDVDPVAGHRRMAAIRTWFFVFGTDWDRALNGIGTANMRKAPALVAQPPTACLLATQMALLRAPILLNEGTSSILPAPCACMTRRSCFMRGVSFRHKPVIGPKTPPAPALSTATSRRPMRASV